MQKNAPPLNGSALNNAAVSAPDGDLFRNDDVASVADGKKLSIGGSELHPGVTIIINRVHPIVTIVFPLLF